MNVAVIDVGSNTVRLLVARNGVRGLQRIYEERTPTALGAEIERSGVLSEEKLAEVAGAVADAVTAARLANAAKIEVLITSPGRQSENGAALQEVLAGASPARVRVLSAGEEARLAYIGALACTRVREKSVAVCDVGGGSAQISVGAPDGEPVWMRSVDIGSLRLTRRHLEGDPPDAGQLTAARTAVEGELAGLVPPLPQAALATGGTARALRKLAGPRLGAAELAQAIELFAGRTSKELAADYGIAPWRARLLPAGTLILTEIQDRLGVPLQVARGGLREGAVLELFELDAAAA